ITDYVLYWGSSTIAKVGGEPLATFPRGAPEHVFRFAADTKAPPGATHLLVFSRNAGGESATAVSALLANKPQYVDVVSSLKEDPGTTFYEQKPRAIVDTARKKLIIVAEVEAAGVADSHLGTFICELDGTACSYSFTCTEDSCGSDPSPVLAPNDKLVIA